MPDQHRERREDVAEAIADRLGLTDVELRRRERRVTGAVLDVEPRAFACTAAPYPRGR